MTDYTSKGLAKPLGGEFATVGREQYNNNTDRINSFGMGAYECTSTTRPAGTDRWPGLIIRETDTGQTYIFNGTKWMWLGGSWSTVRSRGAFTATASTVNQMIGGITTDLRSFGPTIPYNTAGNPNEFELPDGLWLIHARASVASTSGQALQIYAPTAGVILAEGTFTAPNQVTAITGVMTSSGATRMYPRYRNSTASPVTWDNVVIEIYRISSVHTT